METQDGNREGTNLGQQAVVGEEWEEFWRGTPYINETKPTDFGRFCYTNFLKEPGSVIEIGCGHGRDASFFRSQGHIVYAYDISPSAINHAMRLFNRKGIKFYCRDIIGGDLGVRMCNHSYARWLLHTLPPGIGERAVIKLQQVTKPGGYICLEYKTEKTEGTSIYNKEHYRVPVNARGLISFGFNLGLELVYHREGYGLSKIGEHDPYLARTIFRRPE